MLLLKAETIKCNYVPHAFCFSLTKPVLLMKALYLFKVVLLPCVCFAFSAVLGLFKNNARYK